MTELSFAKTFLTNLDSKPTKVSADHVEDPKSYPARSAYILPKNPRPLQKKIKLTPGAERSISVTLKSLRNPPLDITLPSLPLSTSILAIKDSISSQTSIPTTKLRLLWNKKPVGDSKVLKDVVSEEVRENGGKVEFGIMVVGGMASVKRDEEKEPGVEFENVLTGHGGELLKTEAFWEDLKGYLVQRLKDEGEGERIWGVFKRAVEAEK